MKNGNPVLILAFAVFLLPVTELSARTWKEICRSGKIRVLTTDAYRNNSKGLHRIVMPIDREQAMLKGFAQEHKLKVEYVSVRNFSSLFSLLAAGKGDLISANLAETPERKKKYLLSIPFDSTQEIVFTSEKSGINGKTPSCLAGKTGWLLPGTTYSRNFRSFTVKTKNIIVKDLKSTISHDELIERVYSGKIQYSVLNNCDLDAFLSYRTGIRKLFSVRDHVPLVFAAGRKSEELIRQLNSYILQVISPDGKKAAAPAKDSIVRSFDDLPVIRKRGFIRMLTNNDSFSCYLQKGQLCGFEYELAKRFGDNLDIIVVTVIPVKFEDLTKYLAQGRGDFIAANFTKTPERIKAFPNLTFCAPYCGVTEVLAGRPGEKISGLADLAGRKIHVRKGNSYYQTLCKLQAKGAKFRIVPVPESQRTVETLRKVASGEYDLTVADNTQLQFAVNSGSKLRKLMDLTPEQPFSWVVRKDNPKLAAAINDFFRRENRSTFFNLCKNRYYGPKQAKKIMGFLSKDKKTISKYDALFRKYGGQYHFKWYFLAAQSYQESRFNPTLVNHIGAAGLMQVMPDTAKEIKESNLTNPDNGIRAGSKYMFILRDRFREDLRPEDRLCFALASYNAGYGHLQDARKLATELGLDPNRWYKNTEIALSLLEDPKYASRAKYGYCRASETIPYVNNIMVQTFHYMALLKLQEEKKKSSLKN